MPLERKVPILYWKGLHAWAAHQFATAAKAYASDIQLAALGRTVNGKSIIDILTLGAGAGVELTILAEGPDAEVAVDTLATLVQDNFGEAQKDGD